MTAADDHLGEQPPTTTAPRRALVIDDSAAVRKELAAVLTSLGFEALEAEDGGAGFRSWQADPVDVVFLDIEMPGTSGTTLLRVIRATGSKVPVVLVTGTTETRKVASVIKLGASDYLPKPFTEASVRDVLLRIGLAPREPG